MEYFTAMTTIARVNAARLVVLTYRSFKTYKKIIKYNTSKSHAQVQDTKRKFRYLECRDGFNRLNKSNFAQTLRHYIAHSLFLTFTVVEE